MTGYASKGIFSFEFSFDDGANPELITRGFAFDFGDRLQSAIDSNLVMLSGGYDPCTIMIVGENDEFDTIMADLEEYGVHDLYGFADTAFISLGIATYEVERDKVDELLTKWREWFVTQCEFVGELREVDTDQTPQHQWDMLTNVQ